MVVIVVIVFVVIMVVIGVSSKQIITKPSFQYCLQTNFYGSQAGRQAHNFLL